MAIIMLFNANMLYTTRPRHTISTAFKHHSQAQYQLKFEQGNNSSKQSTMNKIKLTSLNAHATTNHQLTSLNNSISTIMGIS
jgi:hypothetical protein